MDALLEFLSWFDWMRPIKAYIDDWRFGPSATFALVWPTHMSGHEINKALAQYGIKSWGWMVVRPFRSEETYMMFSVKEQQARWTFYLLQQWQLPIAYLPKVLRPELAHGNGRMAA